MASSANVTFDYWVLYGSGYNIGYKGTGGISVSRAAGAAKATVTGSASIMSYGGDEVSWTLHMKVGDNAEVTSNFKKTGHGAYWDSSEGRYITDYDTASISQSVDANDSGGSLNVKLWVTINDDYATSGTSSSVQSATVTYDSRGSAVINSCANMTIGSAVSIGWTAYSTGLYYEFKFTCGNFTAWSGVMTVSATGTQTYTGYTVPTSIAAYLGAASTSGKVTVTLSTYTKDSSGNYSWIGSSSKEVTVYTTKAVAPTMQTSWTLAESNSSNPFKDTGKTTGADGTYRFVKDVTKFKLTVYAYSKYGSTLNTLSGYLGSSSSNSFSVSFASTGSKTSDGYTIYKAEAYIEAKTSGDVTLNFRAYDARGYCCPVVSNGIFTATAATSQADGDRAYVKVKIAAYILPQIKDLTLSTSGTTVTVTATTLSMDVISTASASLNSLTAKLTRKKMSTGASTTVDVTSKLGFGLKSNITLYSETLSDVATESYEYTLVLSDKYTSDTESKSTGVVALSFYKGGKGAAFFGEATAEGLRVVGDFYVVNPDSQQAFAWIYPSGGSAALRFYEPTAYKWSWVMESRNIGDDTNIIPEVVGWDSNNQSFMFRFSKSDAYVQGWAGIGSATTPVYFDSYGQARPCTSISAGITSLPYFANRGSATNPIYIDSNGSPIPCTKLNSIIIQKAYKVPVGKVDSNSGRVQSSINYDLGSGLYAVGIVGCETRVATSADGEYSRDNAYRIYVTRLNVSAAAGGNSCTVFYDVTNEGQTTWYVQLGIRILCIYAP